MACYRYDNNTRTKKRMEKKWKDEVIETNERGNAWNSYLRKLKQKTQDK